MSAAVKSKVADWRHGSAGFFRWLEDVRPMVPSSKGGYEPYIPGPRERAEIAQALDGDYSTVVFCWPRRHGKTLVSALIIVWRFLTRRTQNIAIVANSEKQSVDTAFKTVKTIIEQTDYTKALVKSGAITIGADKIEYAAVGDIIQGFSSNPAALYGKKLSVAQISELHAATSDAAYQVLASSTIDTDDGLVLVDSTTGARSSPLFALYSTAQRGDDPSLFFQPYRIPRPRRRLHQRSPLDQSRQAAQPCRTDAPGRIRATAPQPVDRGHIGPVPAGSARQGARQLQARPARHHRRRGL